MTNDPDDDPDDDDDDDDDDEPLPPDHIPSQIELVCAICKAFGKDVSVSPRVMNSVIAGANLIVEQLERPDVKAVPNMGLRKWLASDDTGVSSLYLASVLAPKIGERALPPDESHGKLWGWHPHDPADFGRCVRLLEAVPTLRPHLTELADPKYGVVWNALAGRWAELEALYREDLPSGQSDRLYKILKEFHTAHCS